MFSNFYQLLIIYGKALVFQILDEAYVKIGVDVGPPLFSCSCQKFMFIVSLTKCISPLICVR